MIVFMIVVVVVILVCFRINVNGLIVILVILFVSRCGLV